MVWGLLRRATRWVCVAAVVALVLGAAPRTAIAQDAAAAVLRVTDVASPDASDAATDAAPDASHAAATHADAHAAPATALPPVGDVARIVLGLLVLLALSLLAGHPAVGRFERRAGLAMFVATGMPFLALGLIAHLPSVGVLSDATLAGLRPVLEFGLGWIGFRVGSGFDVRELDRLPSGTGRLVAMESGGAFVAAGLASIAALVALAGRGALGQRADLLRDGLVLGACAAVSAPSGARALEAARIIDAHTSRLIRRVAVLDNAVPVIVLALVTSVFRPLGDAGRWRLPALGWVFVQVGMGAALGVLTVALRRSARSSSEQVAVTLGAIAFASGAAGYLGFSPLAIGCVAGVLVINASSTDIGDAQGRDVAEQLRDLERPIYLVFFAIAGATWELADWHGWLIVPLFVLARLAGKLGGARAGFAAARAEARQARAHAASAAPVAASNAHRADTLATPAPPERTSWVPLASVHDGRAFGVALIPTGAVSIAVIVSARQTYPVNIRPYLETVVIVGAIVAELVFQVRAPRPAPPLPPPPAPTPSPGVAP